MASEVWLAIRKSKQKWKKLGNSEAKKIKSTITQLRQWMDLAGEASIKTQQSESKNEIKERRSAPDMTAENVAATMA